MRSMRFFVSVVLIGIMHAALRADVLFLDGGITLDGPQSIGINNAGQVYVNGASELFRDTDGTVTVIAPPPGFSNVAFWTINNAGALGGEGRVSGASRALIRTSDGSYFTIPQSGSLRGTGINDSGDGVGWVEGFQERAFLYRASDGSFNLLPLPAGGTNTNGFNVSNTRIVTGKVSSAGSSRAFRYAADAGGGSESVEVIPLPSSEPTDINDAGVVVGDANPIVPFRWDTDGTVTILQNTGGGIAFGINNANEVVGNINPGAPHAAYWSADGVLTNLNDLLTPAQRFNWTLNVAWDINESHTIVGHGRFDPDGPSGPAAAEQRLFLMTIPEPSFAAALASLALLLLRLRRQTRVGNVEC